MPSKRSRARLTKELLDAANSLSEEEFGAYLPDDRKITTKDGTATYQWAFNRSANLSEEEFMSCFKLIETTSSADYKAASQGWHPDAKQEEMRETDMRYILLRQEGSEDLLAFTSFMLTPEEDEPVIYIYEIHLTSKLRGSGIGKALVDLVEGIGRAVGVAMSMLTVFTANKHAEAFYRYMGYKEDVSSPRERKLRGGIVKKPEFLIMSKSLRDSALVKRAKKST